ncbi:TPA: PTS sugar transporter subunit IIA [Streptococcus suis]|nr:PTS sugar transporter subunit IIA [Streptococcus suis]HEM3944246.1 PTS sugar transporter subunit IIA [Streptococcus suis]HEM3950218.1 PTS sugar transporter subunit IIA [Streptococcus suis]HEM3954251.1 PTS sugar transporter subunit IIA [Streptococcus suis]HEM3956158.1 PTS sugar transporter subunit IIA [Streptococcus suis]
MIILASHGHLASGMKHTAEMIVGIRDDLLAFDAYCDGVDSIKENVTQVIEECSEEPIILLTDILGGSVNNELSQLVRDFPNVKILTGMNLPLILSLLTGDSRDLESAIDEGKMSIINVNKLLEHFEEDDL